MENNIIPITLGSFFSNAIFSLAAIYPNLNIDVFHVIRREGENIVNPTDRRILEIMSNEILDDRIRCKMIQI